MVIKITKIFTEKKIKIIAIIVCVLMLATTVPVNVAAEETPRSFQQLTPRNNGESVIGKIPRPIDEKRGYFDSLIDQNGNIVYFYELGNKIGFCTGRYNISTGLWETLTPTGWSANPDAIPLSIGDGFFTTSGMSFGTPRYRFLRLTDTTNEIFAVVTGIGRYGVFDFDEHGDPFNYVLQGDKWLNRYSSVTTTNPLVRSAVVYTYRWSANFGFATNGQGQGLLIAFGALSDSGPKGFFPARYDQDQESLNKNAYWVNWRNNNGDIGWDSSGAYQRVFSGLPWSGASIFEVGYAGHSPVGSDVYLINANHAVFRYDDGNQTWYIWNNNHWEPDLGQSTYQNVFTSMYYSNPNNGAILRCGNEVLLFQNNFRIADGYAKNISIRYVKTDGTSSYNLVSSDADVPGIPPLSFKHITPFWRTNPYTILNDPAGNIVIYYMIDNTTTKLGELYRVMYNGQWNTPEGPFYRSSHPANETSVLNAIYPEPEQGSSPIVFLNDGDKILCLGDASDLLWANEQPVVLTDEIPPLANINSSLFSWNCSFVNQASDNQVAWFLATDADGYLYTLQTFSYPIAIFPPDANTSENSVYWGHDWSDGLAFPGPLAVDNSRNRIFFFDQLDSQPGTLNARIRWLSTAYRTQFIYNYGGNHMFPENNGIIWYNGVALKMPTGIVIDEAAGLLYASSSITGEIYKFDISFTSQNYPINQGVFISGLGGPTGMTQDENGRFYIVESTKHRVSIFEPNGSYVESFGTMGRGPGQFYYPTHIAYSPDYGLFYVADPQNYRVQVFDRNHQFITQWGIWPNCFSHNFTQLGGITAKGQFLYVSTYNAYANQINFSGYKGFIHRFKIQDEAPTNVHISQPLNGTTIYHPIAVGFTAQDDWGIEQAELLVDGQVVGTTTYTRIKNISDFFYWIPRVLKNGKHMLTVRITDLRGQKTVSENITIFTLVPIPTRVPLPKTYTDNPSRDVLLHYYVNYTI
jgi:hypothetical protein